MRTINLAITAIAIAAAASTSAFADGVGTNNTNTSQSDSANNGPSSHVDQPYYPGARMSDSDALLLKLDISRNKEPSGD